MESIPLMDLSSLVEDIHVNTREASQNTDLDMREFLGINKVLQSIQGELLNNTSKLTKIRTEVGSRKSSYLEHVYMRPEVNSNQFEISNSFEMSFRLHGNLHRDFTAATFQTIARLYCTCANDIF